MKFESSFSSRYNLLQKGFVHRRGSSLSLGKASIQCENIQTMTERYLSPWDVRSCIKPICQTSNGPLVSLQCPEAMQADFPELCFREVEEWGKRFCGLVNVSSLVLIHGCYHFSSRTMVWCRYSGEEWGFYSLVRLGCCSQGLNSGLLLGRQILDHWDTGEALEYIRGDQKFCW